MFYNADGGLTTLGYTFVAILVFSLIILIAVITEKNKKFGTTQIAFTSMAIALATAFSFVKLFSMPMGGSVTLLSMFLVTLVAYWYGPTAGIMAGAVYGLIQMAINPYIISIPQMLIDYIFAFGALGLAGFFRNRKNGIIKGYIFGIFGRFFFSFLSGVIFFGMYAPESFSMLGRDIPLNAYTYSALYNGGYIFAEGVLTVAILMIPAMRKTMEYVKGMATNTLTRQTKNA
ncbi:MAG: energy-coupled thiamine transporter ThiT [Mogibacterium sp.]|nr:energy-coupled thiamine transporter ThiT [Mogibacterium sp.]